MSLKAVFQFILFTTEGIFIYLIFSILLPADLYSDEQEQGSKGGSSSSKGSRDAAGAYYFHVEPESKTGFFKSVSGLKSEAEVIGVLKPPQEPPGPPKPPEVPKAPAGGGQTNEPPGPPIEPPKSEQLQMLIDKPKKMFETQSNVFKSSDTISAPMSMMGLTKAEELPGPPPLVEEEVPAATAPGLGDEPPKQTRTTTSEEFDGGSRPPRGDWPPKGASGIPTESKFPPPVPPKPPLAPIPAEEVGPIEPPPPVIPPNQLILIEEEVPPSTPPGLGDEPPPPTQTRTTTSQGPPPLVEEEVPASTRPGLGDEPPPPTRTTQEADIPPFPFPPRPPTEITTRESKLPPPRPPKPPLAPIPAEEVGPIEPPPPVEPPRLEIPPPTQPVVLPPKGETPLADLTFTADEAYISGEAGLLPQEGGGLIEPEFVGGEINQPLMIGEFYRGGEKQFRHMESSLEGGAVRSSSFQEPPSSQPFPEQQQQQQQQNQCN